MKISNWMTKEVETCRPENTLDLAAEMMLRNDCGSVAVVDDERQLIGMITDRDICMCGLIEGQPLNRLLVSRAMTAQVWTCAPDDTLDDAQMLMRLHRVSRLPVVDPKKGLIGMFRLGDLARATGTKNGPKHNAIVQTLETLTERRALEGTEALAGTEAGETTTA